MNKKLLAVAGIAAASALILSGCASTDGGSNGGGASPATGEPIVVAGLSGLTFFPEAPQAVQAVFDDYNADGGFNGRPLEYTVYDDKTDPAASATAAKDALDSGAVALVGSSSLLDCAVNHTTWEDNNIVSLQGTGVDSFCFGTPNIASREYRPLLRHGGHALRRFGESRLREHLRPAGDRTMRSARPTTTTSSPIGRTPPGTRSPTSTTPSFAVRRRTRPTSRI